MNIKNTKFLFDDNEEHYLTEFQKSKGYILFFYPKASTTGCTLETIAYNTQYQDFLNYGYSVIGISRDNPKRQNKFKCDHEVVFPLVCDIDSKLCEHFGVLRQKKMFNNTFLGIVRSTFLVDNDFNIIKEWRAVKPVEHIKEVFASISNL